MRGRINAIGMLLLLIPGAGVAVDDEAFWDDAVAGVNEGQLEWVAAAAVEPGHRQLHRLTVTEQSLVTGWVALHQCHYQLDPVDRVEVVFRPGRVKSLALGDYHGIAQARVVGDSVQLRQVGKGAWLCLRAQTRALHPGGAARFTLRNGPFMRRFLDGYYALRLEMEVVLPDAGWELVAMDPVLRPGISKAEAGMVALEAHFKGRLETTLIFEKRNE